MSEVETGKFAADNSNKDSFSKKVGDKIERVGEIALGGFLFRRDIRKELHSELHGAPPFKITE